MSSKSSKTVTVKKSHLKEDSKAFKGIQKDVKDINKKLKTLTARDAKVKK